MEGHRVNRAAVAFLLQQTAAGLHIPQPPSFIKAGSPHMAPHGMEGNPTKPPLMPLHCPVKSGRFDSTENKTLEVCVQQCDQSFKQKEKQVEGTPA